MGEPRDLRYPELPRLSSQLGDRLINLYKKDCPASREFLYMGREFRAFHASYQIVRPYLQQPSYFISSAGSALIRNIHDGVEIICEDLIEDVQIFTEQLEKAERMNQKRTNPFFIFHGGNSNTRDRNKRILKFFEEEDYALERCQLRYGTMLLNLMLAVFVYAQCIHDVGDEATFHDTSASIITDLYTALTELRRRENRKKRKRRADVLLVEAASWWDGLPIQPPNVEPVAPLAILTRIWVDPEARMASRPSPDTEGMRDLARQWREHSQQQRRNTLQLDADNQRLSGANQQLTSNNIRLRQEAEELEAKNGTLQGAINRLQQDISRLFEEIQTERSARYEQEQRADFYRGKHDAVHTRLTGLLAENARADRHAMESRLAPAQNSRATGQGTQARERSHHRSTSTQGSLQRSSRPRTSYPPRDGPPVAYETQRLSRPRPHSSSHRSGRSSSSTAVETPDIRSRREQSPQAPPIPIHSRPFRSGF